MAELKPCPFCGGKNVEVLNRLEEEPEMELVGLTKDNWNVLCHDCFALGGVRRTAEEAEEAWNMRAENANNPYWENICKIAEKQRNKGIATYGYGIEENRANLIERIEHLEEELIDGLMYCEWIKECLGREEDG